MQVVALPAEALDRVAARLSRAGFDFVELDDVIRTPRRDIRPAHEKAPHAPLDQGLFVLQYSAPPKGAWQDAVRNTGVVEIGPLPERAVVISATADQALRLSRLPWVDYVGPYLASYKFAPQAPPDHAEFTLQLADTALASDWIADVRSRVGGFLIESRYQGQLTARIHTSLGVARELLNDPFVLGVEAYFEPQPSDERQALSLTGISSPSVSSTLTSSTYLNWLAARGITPNALTQSGIIIDIADSGVDTGCGSTTPHKDLLGRVVYFTDFWDPTSGSSRQDTYSHGTVVAGIAAGNPMQGIDTTGATTNGFKQLDAVDSYGRYFYGMGVAPGIRIGSTRKNSGGANAGTIELWAKHAVSQDCNTPAVRCPNPPTWIDPTPNCRATVQNHSTNDYDQAGAMQAPIQPTPARRTLAFAMLIVPR